MAKRRHSLNPAKVKRDAKALERPSRPKPTVSRLRLRRRLRYLWGTSRQWQTVVLLTAQMHIVE